MAYQPTWDMQAPYAAAPSNPMRDFASAPAPAPSSGGKYGGIDPTLLQKMMQSFGGSPAGGGAARQAAAQQMVGGGGADNLSFARKEMFSPQLMGAIDLASKVAPFL